MATLPNSQSVSVVNQNLDSIFIPNQFKIVLPFLHTKLVVGNGFSNVVIAPSSNQGVNYVVLNSISNVKGNNSSVQSNTVLQTSLGDNIFSIQNSVSYDFSGRSVVNVGDINGDGNDDLIIGVPYAARCYVLFGTARGFVNMTEGFTIFGAQSSDLTGWSVSGASDINNDTIADFIIGAPEHKHAELIATGAVYVLFGRPQFEPFTDIYLDQLSDAEGWILYGEETADYCGLSVSSAGKLFACYLWHFNF